MHEELKISLGNLPPVARLDEYFGLWAVEETRFLAAFERARTMDLRLHVERADKPKLEKRALLTTPMAADGLPDGLPAAEAPPPAMEVAGRIAVIPLTGVLMKQVGSMEEGTSTVLARMDIRRAREDSSIGGILLLIDSPGGTVSGAADLAAEVAAADAIKPVYAFCEDLCASAAYRVALGARKIFANEPGALVGSIGTLIAMYDYSGAAAMQGIKAKVYKTGELKAAGAMGTEITPAQDAYFQGIVDQTQKLFNQAVMEKRGLDAKGLQAVNTGAVFLASEAKRLGLIDGIKSLDETIGALSAVAGKGKKKPGMKQEESAGERVAAAVEETAAQPAATTREDAMSDPTKDAPATGPKAASLKELKAALPKASAEFHIKALEEGLTVEAAKDRYIAQQEEAIEQARASAKPIGVKPVGTGAKATEASGESFEQLVAATMKDHQALSRREAIKVTARANPEAHKAYKAAMPRASRTDE